MSSTTLDASPMAGRSTLGPMIIIGVLFFIFGFVTWLNGPLITFVKLAFNLDDVNAFLVPFAFYISYLVFSLPASVVLRRTGIFEYIAILAAKRSRGRPYRLMVLLCVLTAVASAVLDNVTTVLLIAPVTFLVCDRLGLKPTPFLIAEVCASNIGGAATLVGDPPNIIIASKAGLSFNDFLIHLAPIVIIVTLVLIALLPRLFPGAFTVDPERDSKEMLAEYMTAFDPRIMALRGNPHQTEVAVKAFAAYAKRVPTEGGNYTMDHTAGV